MASHANNPTYNEPLPTYGRATTGNTIQPSVLTLQDFNEDLHTASSQAVLTEHQDIEKSEAEDDKGASDGAARGHWDRKIEFLLSAIGLSVGLGNVWRFPFLAYENGGGAFLIPYLFFLIFVGKPMYLLELAFGQWTQAGPIKAWEIAMPIGKGIGYAQFTACIFISTYYNVIIAYTLFYTISTFIAVFTGQPVPWGDQFCDSEWALADTCVRTEDSSAAGQTQVLESKTCPGVNASSSAEQYLERFVQWRYHQDDPCDRLGIAEMGEVNWELYACLAAAWLVVALCLSKGIQSTGKAAYFTATFPYLVLAILLVRGATLDGAGEGILYFITPNWSKLLMVKTWRAAASQMFFSLGVAQGSLTMMGSYNKYNNDCYRDSMIVSIFDTSTSVLAGCAMFSVLGYLSKQMDVPIDEVAREGIGLAFIAYPSAIATMEFWPHLWAILFFFMLLLLGLSSQFAGMETVLTVVYDFFPSTRKHKWAVSGIGCSVLCLFGILLCMQGGVDLVAVMNAFGGGFSVMFVATVEVILIMWVYGWKRFIKDCMVDMLGPKGDLSWFWKICWFVISPVALLALVILTFTPYEPFLQQGAFPSWAEGVGWIFSLTSILCIPVVGIIEVFRQKGDTFKEKLSNACWPKNFPRKSKVNTVTMNFPTAMTKTDGITNPSFVFENPSSQSNLELTTFNNQNSNIV